MYLDNKEKEKEEKKQSGVKRKLLDEVEIAKKKQKQIKNDISGLLQSTDKMAMQADFG